MTAVDDTAAPANSDEDEYLTVREVAKKLRVSPMTIYTAINENRLFAVRVGKRRLRIPMSAFRAFVGADSVL